MTLPRFFRSPARFCGLSLENLEEVYVEMSDQKSQVSGNGTWLFSLAHSTDEQYAVIYFLDQCSRKQEPQM